MEKYYNLDKVPAEEFKLLTTNQCLQVISRQLASVEYKLHQLIEMRKAISKLNNF